MPEDALKRIEEKHIDTPYADGFLYCTECEKDVPCNVIKLARALEEASALLEGEGYHARQFRRTLEEVAGDD